MKEPKILTAFRIGRAGLSRLDSLAAEFKTTRSTVIRAALAFAVSHADFRSRLALVAAVTTKDSD